jgi:hypothetical protein
MGDGKIGLLTDVVNGDGERYAVMLKAVIEF